MKTAIVQLNPIIGGIEYNENLIRTAIDRCHTGADLIVFTELVLIGYPPRDLLHRTSFIKDNLAARDRLVEYTKNIKSAIAFGFVDKNPNDGGKNLFNAICIAQNGKIVQVRHKTLLPTYDVFHERRYFEPGKQEDIQPALIDVGGNAVPVGFVICEESWNDLEFWKTHEYPFDPVSLMVQRGAKSIININGSPFRLQNSNQTVSRLRREMVQKHVLKHKVPFAYVNQVGANDEIIFDGNSFIMNAKGEVITHCACAEMDVRVADIFNTPPLMSSVYEIPFEEEVLRILIRGVKDYFEKQIPFQKASAWIGLSGGIDSALVAYIASVALGKDRVCGIGLPSEFSSEGSKSDAEKLANALGIKFFMLPIGNIHNSIRESCKELIKQSGDKYNQTLSTLDPINWGVADENIQPRVRMTLLMFAANITNSILLTTGNKSETAVGYCTLYGDMAGGLAVINDVPKTLVYRLSRYINEATKAEVIPWNTINKPPSAELRPGQKDQDSLPPYDVLDEILEKFVDEEKCVDEIRSEVLTASREILYKSQTGRSLSDDIVWVCNAILRNEHKRKQAPKGLKIGKKHFGEGWQMPIVHRAKL